MRLVIEPGLAAANYWRDLWRYRELMYFLAWRDVLVRYKQTAVGIAWVLLRPALTMAAFVAFRRLVGAPASTVPEPILVFAAVLPWQFFATALLEASGSLVGNASLLSKVYFPRLIIPLAAVATSLVDFAVTLFLLAVLMAVYRIAPQAPLLMLPVFIMLASLLATGSGLLLSALNVRYRDFRYVVPFLIQIGLFVSPVAFTAESIPARWRGWYALNPMVGVIEGFRWTVLGNRVAVDGRAIVISIVATVVVVILGLSYFRRTERNFADVV